MADGKIYITITDKRVGDGGDGVGNKPPRTTIVNTEKTKDNLFNKIITSTYAQDIKKIGSEIVSYSIGNIGNFTGSYNSQENVQIMMSAGSKLWTIAKATMIGGPVLGIATAMGMGVKELMEYHAGKVENNKQNYEIEKLRELSGLNGLTNGSR